MKRILALLISVCFLFLGCEKKPTQYPIKTGGAYEMSNNLSDFTVAINGNVVKFPCEWKVLSDLGFTVDGEKLETGKYNLYTATYEETTLGVYLANFKDETILPKDATVCGIETLADSLISLELSRGVKHLISSKDYVKEKFKNEFTGENELEFKLSDTSFIKLTFNEEILVKTEVLNIQNNQKTEVIKKAPPIVKNYKAPEYLSDNLEDFTFYLYGKTYTFPLPLKELIKGGFFKAGQEYDYIKPHETVENAVKVTKGNRTITLGLKNVADYATTPENCIVTSIESKTSKKLDLTLAGSCRVGNMISSADNAFGKGNFTKIKKTKTKVKYIYKADGKGKLTITANKTSGYITKIKLEAE